MIQNLPESELILCVIGIMMMLIPLTIWAMADLCRLIETKRPGRLFAQGRGVR